MRTPREIAEQWEKDQALIRKLDELAERLRQVELSLAHTEGVMSRIKREVVSDE